MKQNSLHVTLGYSRQFPWFQTMFCMQPWLFIRLDNFESSLNLFSGTGWDAWFFGNQLIDKIISESYPLALNSVCLPSYHFIHQNKPDHVGYQEAKGFYHPSTYSWEKGCITCLRNFWTPCRRKDMLPAVSPRESLHCMTQHRVARASWTLRLSLSPIWQGRPTWWWARNRPSLITPWTGPI